MKKMLLILTCLTVIAGSIAASTPAQAAPDLRRGDMVSVINTLDIGLAVRDAPAGDTITRKYDGTHGSVIGGPTVAVLPSDGRTYTWWEMRWGDDGTEGWSADSFPEPGGADYLRKETKPVSTKFSVGQRVRVVNMYGHNYRVRWGPPRLGLQDRFRQEGDTGTIIDLGFTTITRSTTYYGVPSMSGGIPVETGPADDYFYHFWQIRWDDGQIGWSAEGGLSGDYLFAISDPPMVSHIRITPESSTVLVGDSQSYTVEAFDQYGNSLGDVTSDSIIWQYADEPGAVAYSYGNKLYAVRSGGCTVAAYYAGKYDTARLYAEERPLPYIHGWAINDSAYSPWPSWEPGLPNCSVYLDGVLVTTTDENGHFLIPTLSPRVYQVRMQPPPGYHPWEDSWTVRELDATGGLLTWWRFRVQWFRTFEFYAVGDQELDVPFPVTIWVRDPFGNLDSSYSGRAVLSVFAEFDDEYPPDYWEPELEVLGSHPPEDPDYWNVIEFTNGVWSGLVQLYYFDPDFTPDPSAPLRLWAYNPWGDDPFGSSNRFALISQEPPPEVEQRFQAPYRYSSEYGWDRSFLVGDADHSKKVDRDAGTGSIQARAISGLGGDGQALAQFRLGDLWVSNQAGPTDIAARFTISDGMIAWSEISIFGISGQVFCGITLQVLLTVYDATESKEVFRETLSIYDRPFQWRIISRPDADSVLYKDAEYIIQGPLDLQEGHYYTWEFTAQVHTWVISAGPVAYAVANGFASIELNDVVVGPPTSAPQPAPITSEFMHALLASPADVLITDPEGRRTGFDPITQEDVNEIPGAWYTGQGTSPQLVEVFGLVPGDYRFLVSGKDIGDYKLSVLRGDLSNEDKLDLATFQSVDIPTSPNQLHQYVIDWDALARGEDGVTVSVDSDGDGEFERTFTTGSELSGEQFILNTETFIDFDPNVLNLRARGGLVTVYIELPEGFDVHEIDILSIRLNGTVPALSWATSIGDYTSNGIPDLMVKFDRRAVQKVVGVGESVEITITGEVGAIPFMGTDTIRVIG